ALSFAQLERYLPDVQAALEAAAAAGRHDWCAQLALSLAVFFDRRGLQREARPVVERGLAAVEQLPEEALAVHAAPLREETGLHLAQVGWAEAEAGARRALELFERVQDAAGMAECRNMLGLAAKNRGDYSLAREHFPGALAAYRELGDAIGAAVVLNNL